MDADGHVNVCYSCPNNAFLGEKHMIGSAKSLQKTESIGVHAALVVCAIAMIGVSLYLTKHYFNVIFPTGMEGASACNINSFFNCDTTTNSPASNLMGVPISLFGILAGCFLLLGYLFRNEETEGTNHFLAGVNFVGCIALFLYSLFVLRGLCPFCTVYYVLSGIVFFIFYKYSDIRRPSFKWLAIYFVLTAIPAGAMYSSVQDKKKNVSILKDSLIQQYDALEKLGTPKQDSPYRIASSTPVFADAPIQISIFSDFQCPACKALSEYMAPLESRYHGKINIQYFFYPLDMACNPKMTHNLHEFACKEAYIAACTGDKFAEVHDKLFAMQDNLTIEALDKYAKELGVTECAASEETKAKVKALLEEGNNFGVSSTPTMLVNGVKIEGVLPLGQLTMILDELLKRSGK